jgi:hypothetical protein
MFPRKLGKPNHKDDANASDIAPQSRHRHQPQIATPHRMPGKTSSPTTAS